VGPLKSLPRYEFGIGRVICDTIIDSGAGAIYLDLQVALELYERREIELIQIALQNVQLANGTVEQVKYIGRFHLCIDNNQTEIEAFLICLPKMDLILGLPWLCLTKAVPDYDNMSYSFIDDMGKVVYVKPHNGTCKIWNGLNLMAVNSKVFENKYHKLAYKTAPECFQEIVGLPKDKEFEHTINTGNSAPAKVHGRPYSPHEHQLIDTFIKEALKDGIIRPSKSPWSTPLILIKKPEGSTRVCVDYRKLNALTIKD
jgi:hypothetical protein